MFQYTFLVGYFILCITIELAKTFIFNSYEIQNVSPINREWKFIKLYVISANPQSDRPSKFL